MSRSCCQTFESADGVDRQRLVCQQHPDWVCENEPCSPHSPGCVGDDESLIFLIINPTHFDEVTGQLSTIAFQEVHNRDLSVLRESKTTSKELRVTVEELIERGMQRVPPQCRTIELFARALASSVREQVDADHARLFAVYDTALPDKRGHASVFTRKDVIDSKSKRAIARRKLHALFSSDVNQISNLKLP